MAYVPISPVSAGDLWDAAKLNQLIANQVALNAKTGSPTTYTANSVLIADSSGNASAVALSKGQLLKGNASGAPTAFSVGNAGDSLRTNTSGDLEWARETCSVNEEAIYFFASAV